MYCRICGAEDARWYASKRTILCKECASETADKVSFDKFRMTMWPAKMRAKHGEVSPMIERDFYSDYIAGTSNLRDYIADVRS